MFGDTSRKELVKVGIGEEAADLAVVGGKHVNVHSGEIIEEDVAIKGDRIAFVGDVDDVIDDSTEIINAEGKYITPGLIDGHQHSYHSYINGTEFAKLMLKHGTTAYADGFYGQGVVSGRKAIDYLKDEIEKTPLKLVFLVPTLVHLQNDELGIPSTPEKLSPEEMNEMLEWEDCHGLEEPPYLPILDLDDTYIDLFEKTLSLKKVVTGHGSGVSKAGLNAYVASGAATDHEVTNKEDAMEWSRRGMYLLSRWGSTAPDVIEISKAVSEEKFDNRNFAFCTDMQVVVDTAREGYIDRNVQVAIQNGVNPISAVQMGTLNTAHALRIDHELGSIIPGKVADIVLVEDLEEFEVDTVIASGEVVVENSELTFDLKIPDYPDWMKDTINLERPIKQEDLKVSSDKEEVTVRTVLIEDGSIITEEGRATLEVENGAVQTSIEKDILKGVMIDRHEASGRIGKAFVKGYGLKNGAFGSSVNALRENIVSVGTNDMDIAKVANRISELNGGVVVVKNGEVIAEVPLPLFGLQSDDVSDKVIEKFEEVAKALNELGCGLTSPLTNLEFMCACGEIPYIKISDYGLVDIEEREMIDLIVD
ncbi:hypothetical protein AKJ40_02000 [candidate division MSBL1 archaeon SCGC-AAA259M10]|uniref:Adenine deaminase n=1 Tax=candidate division MSBL1 archaeon SCGC-AAA259M10 TaxID=1698270 RepID=A0A133V0S2_9EURY|nr:hypothetical protein AKJ40_02000 [candidate division MSBL1 archaeon SCGC-AAA259M10]